MAALFAMVIPACASEETAPPASEQGAGGSGGTDEDAAADEDAEVEDDASTEEDAASESDAEAEADAPAECDEDAEKPTCENEGEIVICDGGDWKCSVPTDAGE